MRATLIEAIEKAKELLYFNTSMALDLICEDLAATGLNATFSGRSIYIDNLRVASIKTCVEAKDAVGIYDYTILIKE